MARIAFFTETLPPNSDLIARFSFDLIRSLADQEHEILVFSTYRPEAELPKSHPRIEILRPFRKWSWLEIPKIIQPLLQFRPEVLHFIQPRAEALEGFTNAMNAIAGLAPVIGKPSFVSSFYDVQPQSLKEHSLLLKASDAVTVSNQPQADLIIQTLESLHHASKKPRWNQPQVRILPVPGVVATLHESKNASAQASETATLETFFSQNQNVVVVPGDIGNHHDPESLFEILAELLAAQHHTAILFAGGWGRISPLRRRRLMNAFEKRALGSRVLISGPLNENQERLALINAKVVFAASLPNSALELTHFIRQALSTHSVLILNREQSSLDSIPWRHREHAFLCDPHPASWGPALAQALSEEDTAQTIRNHLPEFARLEALDQPSNVMSRIYAEILGQNPSRSF